MSQDFRISRRILSATAAGALLALAGCARNTMKSNDSELQMTKDIDLGFILDTTRPLQLAIPIKNTSGRVITIHQVSKDCSCTSVHVDELKLPPGESTTLRVVSNLTGKAGQYIGIVAIESDAVEKIDEIQIRGIITGQVRVRPASATVLVGDRSVTGAFTVFCDNQNGEWKYKGFSPDASQLTVELKESKTTPTTSVYDGVIAIDPEANWKSPAAYRLTTVTLRFANDRLGKDLEINYPVEIAVRRSVTLDPPQVTFISREAQQRRTVLIQSTEAMDINVAKSNSPCLRASLRRIDARSCLLDLVFLPSLEQADSVQQNLKCDLENEGKTIGTVPINIVDIR